MARPRNPKPKKSNNDYRGGAALLKKQQEANTKKYKAMTPAQKKAYNVKQAKAIGKTAAQVASMVGGAGLARKAGVKIALKADNRLQRRIRGLTGKVKIEKGLSKMGKALSNSVPPKRTTRASQPTSQLERNIGRHSTLRKKFPKNVKP